MSFQVSIHAFFANYVNFRDRSSRSEFWYAMLFVALAAAAAHLVDSAIGRHVAYPLFCLGVFVPQLSVQVRRLHDVDRTGWWILLIPTISGLAGGLMAIALTAGSNLSANDLGPVVAKVLLATLVMLAIYAVLFVWFCMRGTPGPNRFGPDPMHRTYDRSGARGLGTRA